MSKTVAILQARMGSTRLPGKTLLPIGEPPMLGMVAHRVRRARTLDSVLVATSTAPEDDRIADYCLRNGFAYFRGSEKDVLDRYYQAARFASASTVVRVTADCPLIDPEVIDAVVEAFRQGDFDYVSNIDPPTFPDGLDTEVFTFAALECAWREARLPSEREHVTPYLRHTSGRFRRHNVRHTIDLSEHRWTVDDPADLAFVRLVCEALETDAFGMEEVLELMRNHPEIREMNAGTQRNEGYLRSLALENAA